MPETLLTCLFLGLPTDLLLQVFLRTLFANKLTYQILKIPFKIINFVLQNYNDDNLKFFVLFAVKEKETFP